MRASRSNSHYLETPSKNPVESKAPFHPPGAQAANGNPFRSPRRRGLFWHPGCVMRNHEPAIAALFVNLRLDDGKAEGLTALVFAFDAYNAGRPRRRLIDMDVRRSFRR